MNQLSSDCVRPLEAAENYFLEVLLSRFRLSRKGAGAVLELNFDERTPAIWGRSGVRHLRDNIPDFERKAAREQERLDKFLLANEGEEYVFDDPEFLFRYASGGTLPVLRRDKKDYYCLIYRDIYPVGWNITNGGCDSRDELRNPLEAAERELREELVIFDPARRRRYIFAGEAGKPSDWPEFSTARRLWAEKLGVRLEDLQEQQIPLKWLDGHDHLVVRFGDHPADVTTGGFININALDFGIELDRVARIGVDSDAILCDGELISDHLVNAPVALFEVDRFNRMLALGSTEFIPDEVFQGGRRYGGDALEECVEAYLKGIHQHRSAAGIREYESAVKKYDLCPVTRRIIARYLSLHKTDLDPPGGPYHVFISFGTPDDGLAEQVYQFLDTRTRASVFFSKRSNRRSYYDREIEEALDSSQTFIAVATNPRHLEKEWPIYELTRFLSDMLSEKKRSRAKLVPFVSGFKPCDLPGPLRVWDAIECDLSEPERALELLAHRIL